MSLEDNYIFDLKHLLVAVPSGTFSPGKLALQAATCKALGPNAVARTPHLLCHSATKKLGTYVENLLHLSPYM
jgi:hypothetical protein